MGFSSSTAAMACLDDTGYVRWRLRNVYLFFEHEESKGGNQRSQGGDAKHNSKISAGRVRGR